MRIIDRFGGNARIAWLFLHDDGRRLMLTISYCAMACIIALWYESRAFFIGYMISILFLYLYRYKKRITLTNGLFLISALAVFVFVMATQFKSESTHGRLLIYKVSFEMLQNNFLTGIGYGNFKSEYLKYQAAYFSNKSYSTTELLLADNTYHAFNDYFEFFIENGLIGLLVIVIYLGSILFIVIRIFKSRNIPALTIISLCNLIGISIAAMFTHVSDRFFWQLAFLASLLVVLYTFISYNAVVKKGIILIAILLVSFVCSYRHLKKVQSYNLLQEGRFLARAGFPQEALRHYQLNYNILNDNPIFLRDYAEMLMSAEADTLEALRLLKQANRSYEYNELHLDLADCYLSLNRYEMAEKEYLKAIHMVPNRFNSRYALFDFYMHTDQREKAKACGQTILSMPIKIRSSRVDFIRKNTFGKMQDL